jgi:hypothetical protein
MKQIKTFGTFINENDLPQRSSGDDFPDQPQGSMQPPSLPTPGKIHKCNLNLEIPGDNDNFFSNIVGGGKSPYEAALFALTKAWKFLTGPVVPRNHPLSPLKPVLPSRNSEQECMDFLTDIYGSSGEVRGVIQDIVEEKKHLRQSKAGKEFSLSSRMAQIPSTRRDAMIGGFTVNPFEGGYF